jgi:hypothetical protein
MNNKVMNAVDRSTAECCKVESCRTAHGVDDCRKCASYSDILQCVQQIYRDTRWAVTPDGLLQEVG